MRPAGALAATASVLGLLLASGVGLWAHGAGTSLSAAAVSPAVPALKVNLSESPGSIDLGETTNLSASVTGGTPPYSYDWTSLPVGCTPLNRSSLSCTPSEKGTFDVRLTVTDAGGRSASVLAPLTVSVPAPRSGLWSSAAVPIYVFGAGLGVAAAVVSTLLLFRLRRRPRRPPASIVPVSPSPYVPPGGAEEPREPPL